MNIKRISIWGIFIIIVGLIVWGLVAAEKKAAIRATTGTAAVTLPNEVTSADWITGSTTAATTLVEYGDFQCPACGVFHSIVSKLVAEQGDKFRFVFRHFPLAQHANAIPSALAAEAAGQQGKFWEMYDQLYTHQAEWSDVANPSAIFLGYAKNIGLSLEKFTADSKSGTLKEKINTQAKDGSKAGISYTPSFFLNGTLVENPRSYEGFWTLIDPTHVATSTK